MSEPVRPIVVVLDPIPLSELEALESLVRPLLGPDAVADPALAKALGVRFAFRGPVGPTAADVDRARTRS